MLTAPAAPPASIVLVFLAGSSLAVFPCCIVRDRQPITISGLPGQCPTSPKPAPASRFTESNQYNSQPFPAPTSSASQTARQGPLDLTVPPPATATFRWHNAWPALGLAPVESPDPSPTNEARVRRILFSHFAIGSAICFADWQMRCRLIYIRYCRPWQTQSCPVYSVAQPQLLRYRSKWLRKRLSSLPCASG